MSTTASLVLRDLRQSDLEAAQRLSAAMAWPHRLEDWRHLLAAGHGLAACDAEGALLGTTLWWHCGPAAATIGMVLVDTARQGLGIGRRLMLAALARLGPRALMLNATPAGLALYRRLGFHESGRIAQHQGIVAATGAFQAAPARAVETPLIQALDADAFGAERHGFYRQLADFTAIQRPGIPGFALHRRFGRGALVGPVIAETEADAIALIAASLRPGFHRIDIPAEAAALAAWLTEAGLPQVDVAITMTRGDWPAGTGTLQRFALATQAQG